MMRASRAAAVAVAVVLTSCSGAAEGPHSRPRAPCQRSYHYGGPPSAAPRYRMQLRVEPRRRIITGSENVALPAPRPLTRLVFRLWPNGPRQLSEGARLIVQDVSVDGTSVRARRPDPTTLVVEPAAGGKLPATVRAHLRFVVRLPGVALDRLSAGRGWMIAGSFFPILPWNPERGWATDPAPATLAEGSTSPTADFYATVKHPPGLAALATGQRVSSRRGVSTFRARSVRDFAFAVGRFDLARATMHLPEPVRVTVGVLHGVTPSPEQFLARERRALTHLFRRYGPYPWPAFTLAVVPGLGGAGIEYPNMVFQGPASLEFATSHEAGHQWFYSLVGNNQAADPWLDESLASWVGAEEDHSLVFFRRYAVPPAARGKLGAPMSYWDKVSERDYFAGVYAQGVQALSSLGPPRKVDCALRIYAARNAYGIATPSDMLRALEVVFPDARRKLARFGAWTGAAGRAQNRAG